MQQVISALRQIPQQPAPDSSDVLFVVDDAPELDAYAYGEIQFTLKTTRFVGEVDQSGYLVNPG
jgi:hypothetical protein